MNSLPVTLKWNKQVYQLSIELGETATAFKEHVKELTGVPVSRQKLIAKKGGWKGSLPNDVILDNAVIKESKSLIVTLIGSAETLDGPIQKTTFLEDLSVEELQAAENEEMQTAMIAAEGMIHALQLPPHRRDDHKQEFYEYNRLVSGLPQRQIEQHLRHGQGINNQELQGKIAMNLGLELRRGYVNDLAVLGDGTLVSGTDDGHVQLWRHGVQIQDVILSPGGEGGVDSVVTLRQRNSSQVAFATTGRGNLQLWSADADPILNVPGAMPGTTPSSLVCIFGGNSIEYGDEIDNTVTCLATRFQITRLSNPSQFRLPPQNEDERQRRAHALAQEHAVQQALEKAARSVQVFFSFHEKTRNASSLISPTSNPSVHYKILEPTTGLEGSAPITSLASVTLPDTTRLLVAGDSEGGLRMWKVQCTDNSDIEFLPSGFYQLSPPGSRCKIVCMKPIRGGRVAVSTDGVASNSPMRELLGAIALPVPTPRAVYIFDLSMTTTGSNIRPVLQSSLTGHVKDAVICMCQLPNGDLLTGGGKFDATLQLWSRSQIEDNHDMVHSQPKKTLTEIGYVFALTVLPDAKSDSNYYGVAAGRYNTVKIII